jgi:hypothetical protein
MPVKGIAIFVAEIMMCKALDVHICISMSQVNPAFAHLLIAQCSLHNEQMQASPADTP